MARLEDTPEGAHLIRAWEWLAWAYSYRIPQAIQALRYHARRDIRG